jgi:conjugative transfer signal peptidase TraF
MPRRAESSRPPPATRLVARPPEATRPRAPAEPRLGPRPAPWRRLALGGGCAVAACLLAWQAAAHLRFNLSPCIPRGVYYLAAGEPARAGQLVLACPPARAAELALRRRYLRPGSCPDGTRPIGKLVAALAGDRLELAPAGIKVNGQLLSSTAACAVDSGGRPLPRQPPGERRVAAGEVWLLSAHPRSFDSRYFGPIGAAQVLGTMTPLITAGGADPTALVREIRRAHRRPDR